MSLHDRDSGLYLNSHQRIAVVGVGGVGSWVAYLLSISAKVKMLYLIDPDIVEDHNLTRTPYRMSDVGKPKVLALAEIITELDRGVDVVPIQKKSEEVDLQNMGLIIDCRDFVGTDIESQIVAGYDGKSMTVHFNPTGEKIFSVTNNHGYTVPSYVVPPVFLASIIVDYILNPDFSVLGESITTFKMTDVYKKLLGVDLENATNKIDTIPIGENEYIDVYTIGRPQNFVKMVVKDDEGTRFSITVTKRSYRTLKKLKLKGQRAMRFLEYAQYRNKIYDITDDVVYLDGWFIKGGE